MINYLNSTNFEALEALSRLLIDECQLDFKKNYIEYSPALSSCRVYFTLSDRKKNDKLANKILKLSELLRFTDLREEEKRNSDDYSWIDYQFTFVFKGKWYPVTLSTDISKPVV